MVNLKSIAVSAGGAYLLIDGVIGFAHGQAIAYRESIGATKEDRVEHQLEKVEEDKAKLIEAGVGAKLLHIEWEKPIKELVNGKPKARKSKKKGK